MSDFWLISNNQTNEVRHQLVPPGPITIGRDQQCSITLADRAVSRNHATLQWTDSVGAEIGGWRINDAGSSGGTFVNGMRLQFGRSLPLRHGDQIEITPWNFEVVDQHVAIDPSLTVVIASGNENAEDATQVERVQIKDAASFAHNQLLLLLAAGEVIHQAKDEASVFQALVHAVAKSTEFENVAFVRVLGQGESVEVLAQVGDIHDAAGTPRMSRSMLRQARRGPVIAKANDSSTSATIAASLQGMNVRRAICIPVELSGVLFGFLYLDDSRLRDEAMLTQIASISGAVARMAAQSLGNHQRGRMEQRFAKERELLFGGTMHALISAIDARDPYTRGHSDRVAIFAKMLAESASLGVDMIERARLCGTVHDIGKIGLPDSVYFKVSPLTVEEFAQIAKHPAKGFEILREIPQMRDVLPGVLEHHEKWDGSGYPQKLAGENISLLGRIICIADCFDAMTSDRVFRPAREVEEVLNEIQKCLGKHFDPELGKIFLSIPVEQLRKHVVKTSPAQAKLRSI
jgi:HD-GYP domain-containing protein (c-di-GMP phosphodiesterase class II)